ncbi:MAG: hypothetical protein E7019_01105 [Alphaproteobacteria bacterium]|nr:hypothetical protein [Alphaproteobacteria bacterium]
MIKGIISLFTSGTIFNPMILLGIICGIISINKFEPEQIKSVFYSPNIYVLVGFASFLYTFIFKREYKENSIDLNYAAMLFTIFGGIIKFFLAYVLSMSFVIMIGF